MIHMIAYFTRDLKEGKLDRFLFELSCKNTHTHKHTHTHRDSNEYPIVAFSKNATITSMIHMIAYFTRDLKEGNLL